MKNYSINWMQFSFELRLKSDEKCAIGKYKYFCSSAERGQILLNEVKFCWAVCLSEYQSENCETGGAGSKCKD